MPGLGARTVAKLLQARRVRQLRHADLERLGAPGRKALGFVRLPDHRPDPRAAAAWPSTTSPGYGAASVPRQGDLFAA